MMKFFYHVQILYRNLTKVFQKLCEQSISKKIASLFLVLLLSGKLFSQNINPGHIGKIENGVAPYLNQVFMPFVQGNFAYVVSNGTNKLEIVDITNPAAPLHKSSVSLPGLPNAIYVSGNYAYVPIFGTKGSLEIIDVTNPSEPKHLSNLQIPASGNAISVFVSGSYAYVAIQGGSSSLWVVNVSNPVVPVQAANLLNNVNPFSVFVSGNYAYMVGLGNTLEIVDISVPTAPVHKGSLSDGIGGAKLNFGYSVYVSGSLAYVASEGNSALEIVDVSDPSNPVHKGSIVDGGGVAPFLGGYFAGSWNVVVSGSYAYVSSGNHNALEIIDVSDPTSPTHAGSIKDGSGGALLKTPQSVFISGGYAYVASYNSNALEIIDVTNAQLPVHRSSLLNGSGGALLAFPISVYLSGNYAYVTSQNTNSLEIIDVTNPALPVHLGNIVNGAGGASLNNPVWVAVSGHYAYVASKNDGMLEIVDVSNPAFPVHTSKIAVASPNSVFISGNYAYTVGNNTFNVVDITNPSSPVLVGTLVNGGSTLLAAPRSVYVSGNYAYVASRTSNALEIIDVTNPAAPVHKGALINGSGGASLALPHYAFVSGNYAYVWASSVLEIVDITNPSLPTHKGSYVFGTSGGGQLGSPIYVSGNFAYVLRVDDALDIVDVTNPAVPVRKASLLNATNGVALTNPQSIFVSGNYAYAVSAYSDALEIINLYSPEITSFSPTTGVVGTPVTITGNNLNTFLSVGFNQTPATINGSVQLTSAVVTVPQGATIGKISMATNGPPVFSNINFMVIPSMLPTSNVQQTSFMANWSDVGASEYFLDVSTDNFNTYVGNYNNFSTGVSSSYTVTGLPSGVAYQYRVRSSDGNSLSGYSSTVAALTIPDTPVANIVPAVAETQTSFIASWAPVTNATAYYLDVATDNSFNNTLSSYNNYKVSTTSQNVSGLNSFQNYYYRVRSANATGSSPSSNVIQVLTLDITPPYIGPAASNTATITSGNAPTFGALITDNVSLDSAKIFYRGISQKSFKRTDLQGAGASGGNFSIIIQTTWYDSLGLEYYFMAQDPAGNRTVTNSSYVQLINASITLPALPSGAGQSDYRIVSFPYVLPVDNKVSTVYNGVPWNDNTKAALWWWNPTLRNGSGDYDQYGEGTALQTVDQGKGYWVLTKTQIAPQLTNVPSSKFNRANLFSMTLKPGWNEIGNPYPVPISWDDVVALNQKINPSALFSPLSIYDGTGFKDVTGSKILKAFEGGFVKNLTSSDIVIQIPFLGQQNLGGRMSGINSDVSQDEWNVFLHIKQEGLTNELGGFGMHPLAQSGQDRYDNFNPPKFLDIPEINFTHRELPHILFSNDMVKSREEYTWQFTPVGQYGKSAELNWNPNIFGAAKQLFLLDEESLQVIDMKNVNQYQFILSRSSRFSIFYGSNIQDKIATREIVAGTPYPNPVIGGINSTINLGLPSDISEYDISLQFFNIHGDPVGYLRKTLTPGIHHLEFDMGQDAETQGIYIYKLSVISEKSSKVYTGKIVKL